MAERVSPQNELPARLADPRLLELLVCPKTHCPLRYDAQDQELVSTKAGLAFPIRNGIPIMLVDQARVLEERERANEKASNVVA